MSAGDAVAARIEAEKALQCLFISVPESVARDVRSKVIHAFDAHDKVDQQKTRELNLLVQENRRLEQALRECITDENANAMQPSGRHIRRLREINRVAANALEKAGVTV